MSTASDYYRLPSTFYWADLYTVITEHLVLYAAVVLLIGIVAVVGVSLYTRSLTRVILLKKREVPQFRKYKPIPIDGEPQEEYFEDEYILPPLRTDEGRVISKPDARGAFNMKPESKQDYRVVYFDTPIYPLLLEDEEEENYDDVDDDVEEDYDEEDDEPPTVFYDIESKAYKKHKEEDDPILNNDDELIFVDDEEGGYYIPRSQLDLEGLEGDSSDDEQKKKKKKDKKDKKDNKKDNKKDTDEKKTKKFGFMQKSNQKPSKTEKNANNSNNKNNNPKGKNANPGVNSKTGKPKFIKSPQQIKDEKEAEKRKKDRRKKREAEKKKEEKKKKKELEKSLKRELGQEHDPRGLAYPGEGPYLYRWLYGPTEKTYNNAHYRGLLICIWMVVITCVVMAFAGQIKSNQFQSATFSLIEVADTAFDAGVVVADQAQDRIEVFQELIITQGNPGADELAEDKKYIMDVSYTVWGAYFAMVPIMIDFQETMENIQGNMSSQITYLDALIVLQELGVIEGAPTENDMPKFNITTVNNTYEEAANTMIDATLQMQNLFLDVQSSIPTVSTVPLSVELNISIAYLEGVKSFLGEVSRMINNNFPPLIAYWNPRRLAITFMAYFFPLFIACFGVLGVYTRGARVMRAWAHLTLICAFLSFLFSTITLMGAILLGDVCNQPMSVFAAAIRTQYPALASDRWMGPVLLNFEDLGTCDASTNLLTVVPEPSQTQNLASTKAALQLVRQQNYTAKMVEAENVLLLGVEQSYNVSVFGGVDPNIAYQKLDNISLQIQDLSRFGFDEAAYNAALQSINDLTADFYTNFTDGSPNYHFSVYYGFDNFSSIDMGLYPYSDTNETFRQQLISALNTTTVLAAEYRRIMYFVNLITEAVVGLNDVLITYTRADELMQDLRAQADHAQLYTEYFMPRIAETQVAINSTIDVIIRNIDTILAAYEWVKAGISCTFLGEMKQGLDDVLCGEISSEFITWTTTFGLAGFSLLLAHFAAHFGGHIFTKMYLRYPHVSLRPTFNFKFDDIPNYFAENWGLPSFDFANFNFDFQSLKSKIMPTQKPGESQQPITTQKQQKTEPKEKKSFKFSTISFGAKKDNWDEREENDRL